MIVFFSYEDYDRICITEALCRKIELTTDKFWFSYIDENGYTIYCCKILDKDDYNRMLPLLSLLYNYARDTDLINKTKFYICCNNDEIKSKVTADYKEIC